MSISVINSQVKVFVYVTPREKCVRPTLCAFRVRTIQVLLRTHVCWYLWSQSTILWLNSHCRAVGHYVKWTNETWWVETQAQLCRIQIMECSSYNSSPCSSISGANTSIVRIGFSKGSIIRYTDAPGRLS